MTRPLRIEFEGAWYHVMNRGAGYRPIYGNDDHRELFLTLLADITTTFQVEIHGYCLMGNHYHLLVHTPRSNLGRAMRHLNGVYTQRFNRLEKTDGPLFRGRYRAILVDADNYLLAVSRYIHLNPVAAGQVDVAGEYPWSSYRAYIGAVAKPAWLVTETTLRMISQHHREQRYRAFVEQGVDEELAAFYGTARQSPVLGDEKFRTRMSRDRTFDPEITDLKRLTKQPTLDQIAAATAAAFNVDTTTVYHAERGRQANSLPRMATLYLSRRYAGYPLKTIAEHFNLGHYASVSSSNRRFAVQLAADEELVAKLGHLQQQLFGSARQLNQDKSPYHRAPRKGGHVRY